MLFTRSIPAVAVDQRPGCVCHSDEGFGVRKDHADPLAEDADEEPALSGTIGWFFRKSSGWLRAG